jgi:hypothetical protein
MDDIPPLLLGLVAAVMGWFAIGIIFNLRRGNAVLRWMQAGLPLLGERTTLRWMGSSAVELVIAKAKPPFRRCELVLVMEPRDVPWYWLWTRTRGRRDLLIFRAQLNSSPRLEWDAVDPDTWTGRMALARAADSQWENQALERYRFLAPRASLPVSIEEAPGLLESGLQIQPVLWKLSLRREFPHLELHIPLPDPKTGDARQFFQALRALGQRAAAARETVS